MNEGMWKSANWRALISNLAVGWSLCGEFAIRAIDQPERSTAELTRWADLIVAKPPRVILGHPVQWRKFLWLKRLTLTIMQEVLRRVEGRRAAEALWLALVPPAAEPTALTGLERVLSSARDPYRVYADREKADQPADLRAIAVEGLLKAYAGSGQIYAALIPERIKLPSRAALGLDHLPDGRWHWGKTKIIHFMKVGGPE
jgi:hypothetical protein